MKRIIIILTMSLSFYIGNAQSWSSHLKTGDLPVLIYNGTAVGDLRVMPDAITSNEGNINSIYSEKSVFTAFSPAFFQHGPTNSANWSAPGTEGTWLIAKDLNGTTILSKKLQITGHFLRIWSLQYNYGIGDEMLVFTGSVVRNSDGANRMIVGAYNLLTNTVSIKVAYQPYTYVEDDVTISTYVASQGIGVRKIFSSTHNHFMAIGQSGDAQNGGHPEVQTEPNDPAGINNAMYPIGVIFQVSSAGLVTIDHTEIQDFRFKPNTVTDPFSIPLDGVNGTSIVAGGIKILDATHHTDIEDHYQSYHCIGVHLPICQSPCHYTLVAAAAYTFDAIPNGSSWDIKVDNGVYNIMDDYAHNGIGIYDPVVHAVLIDNGNSTRDVILGTTTTCKDVSISSGIQLDGVGDFVFMRYDISGGNYVIQEDQRYALPDDYYGTLQRIVPVDNLTSFSAILNITSPQNATGNQNGTSIGILTLPVNNLNPSYSVFVKSVYAADVTSGPYETEIYNTTAIHVNTDVPGKHKHVWLVADGNRQTTSAARVHFNSAFLPDAFECEQSILTTRVGAFAYDYEETSMVRKYPTPTWTGGQSTVQNVNYTSWDCTNYDNSSNLRKKNLSVREESNNSISVTPNPSNGLFNINTEGYEEFQYKVIDINGKVVIDQTKSSNNSIELNLSDHPNGMYFLNVISNGTVEITKILKRE